MKKVVALLFVLFAATSCATADSTNWLITVTPWVSEAYVASGTGNMFVGTWTDYTDDTDTDVDLDFGAEAVSLLLPPGVFYGINSTSFVGYIDLFAPLTGTETKVWTLNTFVSDQELTAPINLDFTPGFLGIWDYDPAYSFGGVDYQYTFEGPMVPGGSQTFTALDPMPESWTWTAAADDELTITLSPVTEQMSGGGTGDISSGDSGGGMDTLTTDDPFLVQTARDKNNGEFVRLTCMSIDSVGSGYFILKDYTDDTIKVFTTKTINPAHRVVRIGAIVWTEGGNKVLCTDSGPSGYTIGPYTNKGYISTAPPGTLAYASTLPDQSWVYLTGMVTTWSGPYWSYDIQQGGTHYWTYNVQGLDRSGGMRVWDTSQACPVGTVVDVMAQLDTKDGQRILGIYDTSSSIEETRLAAPGQYETYPTLSPLGMTNLALGGAPVGYSPGVTGGVGLYNTGLLSRIWGKVVAAGTYNFNESVPWPYIRLDDGSGVSAEGTGNKGVTVLGNYYDPYAFSDIDVGDHVAINGVSSIWKPSGSTDTYRCIWPSIGGVQLISEPAEEPVEPLSYGTVSGIVKLYDMPESEAKVSVYSTCGKSTILTVTRDSQTNAGYGQFSWQDIPKTVQGFPFPEELTYVLSAQCEGFKTRTYTLVTPDTPRNLYLTRLRKIYLTAGSNSVAGCSGSTTLTATVRDANHNPVPGVAVTFRTNRGSFSSDSVVHQYTPVSTTNSQGQVTATFYGVPSESGNAAVEATDDSAPLASDNLSDDPYNYDWVQLQNSSGNPDTIAITQPSTSLGLTANPTIIDVCGTAQSTITAYVTGCGGSGLDGVDVTFTTTAGVFSDNSTQKTVTTTGGGYATVYLKGNGTIGISTVSAHAYPYGIDTYDQTPPTVNIATDTLTLSASPVVGQAGQSVAITANVKDAAGNNVSGRTVYFSQTGGNPPASGSDTTDGSGDADWSVSRSATGKVTVTAYEDMTCSTRVTQTLDVWYYDTTPEDWPMFMHDAQHTGMSKTWDVSGETLTRQWIVSLPTADTVRTESWSNHPNPGAAYSATYIFQHPYIDSSPVVVGNKVVVGTWTRGTNYPLPGEQDPATGSIKAFNAANNGSTLWTATGTPSMGGVASTPCVSDGKVYVGTTNGYLYCLDLSNGSQIWARQTTDRSATPGSSRIISSPVVYNGVVYITNEASKVYAFTADTNGTLVAGYPIVLPIDTHGITDVSQQNICGASSPAIATVASNTYLLVGCDDGYVYRINLSDISVSELNMGGCVESSPSVSGNYAYIGVSIFQGLDARRVTIEPFEEIASWQLGEESRATVSLAYDFAYNGVDTGTVFYQMDANETRTAVTPQTLAEEGFASFSDQTTYFLGSAAHTTGGIVYTGNDNSRFYALDASDLHAIVSGGYYDGTIQDPGFVCSSPAIGYNVDANHNRWVFITTRSDGGKLYAFKTTR